MATGEANLRLISSNEDREEMEAFFGVNFKVSKFHYLPALDAQAAVNSHDLVIIVDKFEEDQPDREDETLGLAYVVSYQHLSQASESFWYSLQTFSQFPWGNMFASIHVRTRNEAAFHHFFTGLLTPWVYGDISQDRPSIEELFEIAALSRQYKANHGLASVLNIWVQALIEKEGLPGERQSWNNFEWLVASHEFGLPEIFDRVSLRLTLESPVASTPDGPTICHQETGRPLTRWQKEQLPLGIHERILQCRQQFIQQKIGKLKRLRDKQLSLKYPKPEHGELVDEIVAHETLCYDALDSFLVSIGLPRHCLEDDESDGPQKTLEHWAEQVQYPVAHLLTSKMPSHVFQRLVAEKPTGHLEGPG
ncbi:hypothetical protein NKR23_g10769 [Pleurostoma richardsiae]|uniref:Uncharacterized protein n=1 Tax=Pleurostoma richardsiae TaxID=41990 RepID=A0AA38R4P3_9PEZI|nr:hypothetical protein NKR23_g10769 [Pleurostoma richardsiae]